MATQEQIETTRAVLEELFGMWASRAASYGETMYASALARNSDGQWRNVLTFFQPLSTSAQRSTALNLDYADFRITQGLLSSKDAKNVLIEIVEKEQLTLPNQPVVRLQACLYRDQSRHFWRSDVRRFPVHFPFFEYGFNIDQPSKTFPPQRAIWAANLPVYPSGRVALEDLLHTRLGDDRAYEGVLSVLVPDYRGKISQIRLSNNGLAVQVTCPAGADRQDLLGKVFSEDDYGNRISGDLEFDGNGTAFASTNGFPRHFVVILFSRSGGDLVDERTFDAGSPYNSTDLTFDNPELDIENMIKGGESETVELKSQIPQRHEAIAITAVAFANQRGGRIFVGVENEGQIIGCPGPNVRDTLTNIIRDRCEPPVEFDVRNATVLGKIIFIVTVAEGKDKPYQVKGKGFYIRTGGTNRLATRYEIDEIYNSKSGSSRLDIYSKYY